MTKRRILLLACWIMAGACISKTGRASEGASGVFEGHGDIGKTAKAGALIYAPDKKAYTVTGGGENMWGSEDAFHFVWKRVSGDIALAADIQWIGSGGHAHRKACLLIRQGLEPGAPYADAALHGDGLTSLQFRDQPGGPTHEIQSRVSRPRSLQIERYGDFVSMSVGSGDGLQPAGGCFRLILTDPVYVGIGVCAHDNRTVETATFTNMKLTAKEHSATTNLVLESTLEVISIASTDRKAVFHVRDHIEAPNWSLDGKYLLYNSKGRLWKLPLGSDRPEVLDTGFATRCNNDHGFSPDGSMLAISDQSQGGQSLIYVLPAAGGTPRRVTALGPSYWHGWSPDGKTLAYCAERNREFDIYTIPIEGGRETRLTTAPGLDDGPDYAPDGQWIYFNSERTGTMHIWRMHPDGSQQEQLTSDEQNNWFPHPSPDGKWVVFLSYAQDVKGHPANQHVQLRLMPANGGEIKLLAKLFGGQGTINVPSWSPDSRQVAFVSYRLAPPDWP